MTREQQDPSPEWNAVVWQHAPTPTATWVTGVPETFPASRSEAVVAAEPGTGSLTAVLVKRMPLGRVITAGRTTNMLAGATDNSSRRFVRRVSFLDNCVQPVDCLKPGGRLVAQRGGGSTIRRLHLWVKALSPSGENRENAVGGTRQWESARRRGTALRPEDAGSTRSETCLEPAWIFGYWRPNQPAARLGAA